MIRAIIFDCFGVLTTEGWLPFKDKYFGHDSQLKHQVADLNKQANAGLISHGYFLRKVAELANLTPEEVSRAINVNVANEPLFAYIAKLKPKYKIGILSNVAANHLDTLFTPEQLALFDAISLSYELGFIKPYPLAYKKIADQLGVEPGECVFIDDKERHCIGAREADMQAILYQDFEQMKAELDQLLKN